MYLSRSTLTLTRCFASAAPKSSPMIKPPVAVFGIPGRYATALYSAAMKEKKIETVEKDVRDLKSLMVKDPHVKEFILNPLMQKNLKIENLKKVFTKRNYNNVTLNLLACMAQTGRLKSLEAVLDCFNGIMSNIRGEVICKVVTAKAMDSQMLSEFEKTLKTFVKKDEKVLLETQVDPSLIGGVIVTIGDKYVDMSIATKIKTYNQVLRDLV